MYINSDLIKKEYEQPALKVKDMLSDLLKEVKSIKDINELDTTRFLNAVGLINAYCRKNNIKPIDVDHNNADSNAILVRGVKQYQSLFLTTNDSLYDEFFTPYKHEFKPEKLLELKQLVHEIKEDITIDSSLTEDEKSTITIILDEVDQELKPETNDIDTINGKILRIISVLNINTKSIKQKLNTLFSTINTVDTYVKKAQTAYGQVSGLIENIGNLLSNTPS
jgi:hypothetical protein